MDSRLLIGLVERKGISEFDRALDYQVSTILTTIRESNGP
jgi:hypothetical protein